MSDAVESITWYPINVEPQLRVRCLVHAINNYYQLGMWDSETQRFWDKDGQPIVGGIEWSYRHDRDE